MESKTHVRKWIIFTNCSRMCLLEFRFAHVNFPTHLNIPRAEKHLRANGKNLTNVNATWDRDAERACHLLVYTICDTQCHRPFETVMLGLPKIVQACRAKTIQEGIWSKSSCTS